jgi:CubicO group peptidase (beta-lactamase class C family)
MIKIMSVWILFVVSFSSIAQTGTSLPRSTPEAEGVSSADVLKFIKASEASKNELHSFMILRHGKVIAEGWWDPYKPSLRHTLYSSSKTFTSTAIGFAVSENKIKLSDKVISFFPKDLPIRFHPISRPSPSKTF